MNLQDYILEAVSHGNRSPKLPKELTGDISEKDDICNWLDYNGYTERSEDASVEYLLDCARETPGNYYTTGVVERKGEKVWWITILSNGVILFIRVLKIRVVKMPEITMSICDKPDRNGSGKRRRATYEDIVNQLIG